MSEYNKARTIVRWKEVNVIHEGHRIYKSPTYFEKTALPTPLEEVPRKPTNFGIYEDDTVTAGEANWYRVGVYADGEELVSDALSVSGSTSKPLLFILGANYEEYMIIYDENFNRILRQGYGDYRDDNNIDAVAVDSNRNSYAAQRDYRGFYKYDEIGNNLWNGSTSSRVYAINIHPNGDVYSGDSGGRIGKFSSDGNRLWYINIHSGPIYGLAVDAAGYVYTGGRDNTVRKTSPTGNRVWTFDSAGNQNVNGHSDNVNDVAVDYYGNVYSVSTDNTVRKIDSAGNHVWTFTGHTGTVNSICIGPDDNIITTSSDNTLKKINPNGTVVWSTNAGEAFYSGTVDADGYIYTGMNNSVRKFDSTGTEIVNDTFPNTNYNSNPRGLEHFDVFPGRCTVSQKIPF